jgi:ABC-type transport system involved in multi-copper enzyme maturation permease subunit
MKNNDGKKVTVLYSAPLMKQNIRSNWVICLVILFIMLLLCNVVNYAMSLIGSDKNKTDTAEYQQAFYAYLGALASYDLVSGGNLSYDDFIMRESDENYNLAFGALNAKTGKDFSVDGFEDAITGLSSGGVPVDTYVKAFEYNYALSQSKGVFDKENMTLSECLDITLETMGVSSELVGKMGSMDTSAMINQMYFTVTGLLPIFILVVILANGLIAERVDSGSMAYILSTPTKRSAVAFTQMLFMITVPALIILAVCLSRIATSFLLYDDVNVKSIAALFCGMYILVEAVSAICYLASCFFSQSRKSLGMGGGLTAWFFIASLMGMFGSDNMVNSGMGVKELSVFNKLTLIGLYDIDSLATVGEKDVCYDFVWKMALLVLTAVICYAFGALRFTRKDLPL